MTDHAATLKRLRDLTQDVDRSSTADDLLDQAEAVLLGLSQEERDAAALFYLIRLLKDHHRSAVASVERGAVRPKASAPNRGTAAERREKQYENENRRASRMGDLLRQSLDLYASDLVVEWSDRLLNSTFALPDGSHVLWGEATVEQHQARRDMLMSNAAGNLEAAGRHEAAIRVITAQGVQSLSQRVAA